MAGEQGIGSQYDNIYIDGRGLERFARLIKQYINTNMPSQYSLPTASTSTLGGVKVDGSSITISNGVISATDTDTTYSAGTGISIDANNEIRSTVTGLPSAPSNAGTYFLKCTLSGVNLTPIYSWESVTVGGSY
jgi:hypothetical protein